MLKRDIRLGAGIDLGPHKFESSGSEQVGYGRIAFSVSVESGGPRLIYDCVTISMGPTRPLIVFTTRSQAFVKLVLFPETPANGRVCVREEMAIFWPLTQSLISVALCNPPAIQPVSNCQALPPAILISECVRAIYPGDSWTPEVVEQRLKPLIMFRYCIGTQTHQVLSLSLPDTSIEGCRVGERAFFVEKEYSDAPFIGK